MVAKLDLNIFNFGLSFNRDTDHSRRTIQQLITTSAKRITILSGELNKSFFHNTDTKNALLSAAKKEIDIKIAFGPLTPEKCLKELKDLFDEYKNVTLYKLETRPETHYMIFDNTVRIQHVHPPFQEEPRAVIKRNDPFIASLYDDAFNELVEREGTPV